MFIIKNALKSIGRSKGRNILIGIIALVIAVSACLGLSIRQAALSAKESALEGINITATISYDRAGQMGKIGGRGGSGGGSGSGGSGMPGGFGGFDRSQFSSIMGSASSLSVDEYKKYAEAESVSDFYYTLTAYFNGSDNFSPVSDEDDGTESAETGETGETGETTEEQQGRPNIPGIGGMSGIGGMDFSGMFSSGDFTIVGYSSDSAMTAFANGTTSILEGGTMFEEGTTELDCVISEELAIFNDLSVGDTITVTNPSLDTESYELKITGIYKSSQTNDFSMSFLGKSQDPANQIYMSANALQAILDQSEKNSVTTTSETTGREKESKITGTVAATYTFATPEDYEKFEGQARELGLDESYTISSSDLTAYENSLAPLDTLSTMAKWFLVVILGIGAIILVVLNIFNIRERKYEVGVLTAMGMKKIKVAAQFVCEILVVTMVAVILGAVIGGASSVPVTNALLENQIESQKSQKTDVDRSFGRSANFGGMPGMPGGMPNMPSGISLPEQSGEKEIDNPFEKAANYVSEVDEAMNLTVVLQMIGIGLLLTLVASAASVMFIMRYDPLKILSNRD